MNLSPNKLEYIWFHMRHHWKPNPEITDRFMVVHGDDHLAEETTGRVIFRLTRAEAPSADYDQLPFDEQAIPVLFTNNPNSREWFFITSKGNLLFNHDLLSSIFYMLSGQQEIEKQERDQFGRFSYHSSIQKELNCASVPLVNYYFEIIIRGLEHFAKAHGMHVERRRLFPSFGFALSHDVDRVAYHHIREVLHKVKLLLYSKEKTYQKKKLIREIINGLLTQVNPSGKKDPWWNFDWLITLEKQLDIRSSFYFLQKEDARMDSQYHFSNKKIKHLISDIKEQGFEAGLHGSFYSYNNLRKLQQQASEWAHHTGVQAKGVRQHFLRYKLPETSRIHASIGFLYDTTLGFADHDGYRNGYCHPFCPFDHERDEMVPIWEIPLVMMEMSVLDYRNLSNKQLQMLVFKYIREAEKFGGIFSLLWHNCRLNEMETRGITGFYETLLKQIVKEKPFSVRGTDLVTRIKEFHDEDSEKKRQE